MTLEISHRHTKAERIHAESLNQYIDRQEVQEMHFVKKKSLLELKLYLIGKASIQPYRRISVKRNNVIFDQSQFILNI